MATIYKANSIALQLQSQLLQRGYSGTSLTYDSNNNPVVSYGTGVAGTANAVYLIKEQPETPAAQTTLGSVGPGAFEYAPIQIMLAVEANPTGGSGADILTGQQVTDFLGSAIIYGAKFSLWNSANGVAPSTTTFATASNQKSTFFSDVTWNSLSST